MTFEHNIINTDTQYRYIYQQSTIYINNFKGTSTSIQQLHLYNYVHKFIYNYFKIKIGLFKCEIKTLRLISLKGQNDLKIKPYNDDVSSLFKKSFIDKYHKLCWLSLPIFQFHNISIILYVLHKYWKMQ